LYLERNLHEQVQAVGVDKHEARFDDLFKITLLFVEGDDEDHDEDEIDEEVCQCEERKSQLRLSEESGLDDLVVLLRVDRLIILLVLQAELEGGLYHRPALV